MARFLPSELTVPGGRAGYKLAMKALRVLLLLSWAYGRAGLQGRLVQVSADPRAAARSVVKEWEGLTMGSLLPGMLVNARVRSVLADGLAVSFLTYFHGTVDCFHLGQVCEGPVSGLSPAPVY